MPFYDRKKNRLSGYNYSRENYYFITICTHEKKCIFGEPNRLNFMGMVAKNCMETIPQKYPFARLDSYTVLPNHIHCIIVLDSADPNIKRPDISVIIGQYKMTVTKKIRSLYPDMQIWQRSFHDHIIRNQESYEKIWNYVEYNAQKWNEDCYYPGKI